MQHLLDYSYLTKKQHGFRKGFSCTTQLLDFFNDLESAIDFVGKQTESFSITARPSTLFTILCFIENY